MSAVTHPQSTIKQQLLRDQRRAKIVAVAAVTILAALLVALVLALEGDDAPTAAQQKPAAELPLQPQTGTRYDGGPEEGSRGTSSRSAPNPGRPDGGPEEGTRGPGRYTVVR
jgi:hypothetical protein